jgi:hypothetical protein
MITSFLISPVSYYHNPPDIEVAKDVPSGINSNLDDVFHKMSNGTMTSALNRLNYVRRVLWAALILDVTQDEYREIMSLLLPNPSSIDQFSFRKVTATSLLTSIALDGERFDGSRFESRFGSRLDCSLEPRILEIKHILVRINHFCKIFPLIQELLTDDPQGILDEIVK